ncbi:MAG: Piwi domain-containing protein, partial [Candidatus Hadarchaeum sp.]
MSGLVNGSGRFNGFGSLFRIPIEFSQERGISDESERAVEEAVRAILRDHHPDVFVLITSDRNQALYRSAKTLLLGNGIPNQVVRAATIENAEGLACSLENIALQLYAKAGGTPWTVMSPSRDNELVIGVSRALDRNRNMVIGFVTLFTHDGDYQLLYSLSS